MKVTEGRDVFIIKKTIIELRKDQYVIKNAYRRPIIFTRLTRSSHSIPLDSDFSFDAEGNVIPEGVSLLNPKVVSGVLCNYSRLKEDSWGKFDSDTWCLMEDFDRLADEALKDYPVYERIVEYKVDGM